MVDFFEEQIITIRLNGGLMKHNAEIKVEISNSDTPQMKHFIKDVCKRFGVKEKASIAKLYNKNGVEMMKDDVQYFKHQDVFYLAVEGEPFNFCAILDDYDVQHQIGEGGFGTVKLATHKETRKKYAVKFMDISSALNHADEVNSLYKEANSIKKLRHKNIIELYHSFVEGKQMIMIMELASGGELTDYVQKKGRLDEIEARKILIQIISAIAYCHSSGVVHRDLKLENVLFLDDPEELSVKVIDFGISGVCTTFQNDKVDAGTVAYMPPEAFEGNLNTAPSLDVWAIGLMFYAMLYGTLPFYSQDENQLKQKIRAAKVSFPSDVPVTDMGKELLKMMLHKDPSQRLELLDFMSGDYYNIDDLDFEVLVKQCQEQKAAELEIKNAEKQKLKDEEDRLAFQFDQSLSLPSAGASMGKRGSSPGAKHPKKKKKSTASSAAAAGSVGAASGTKTSHKNKKTTQ